MPGKGGGGVAYLMEGHSAKAWSGAEQSLGAGPEQFLMRTLNNAAHLETIARMNISVVLCVCLCSDADPADLSV